MFRLIIAGSRSFCERQCGGRGDILYHATDDYAFGKEKLNNLLRRVEGFGWDIEVVSGTAKGGDTFGEVYASNKGYKITRMPADWDKYGRSAGHRRNYDMAMYALDAGKDKCGCVVFWDGVSKGSDGMIELCKKYNLPYRVYKY